MKILTDILLAGYLTATGVYDIRHREVSCLLLSLGVVPAAAGIVYALMNTDPGTGDGLKIRLLGLIPGIVIAVISYVTRGGIGIADAVVIMAVGCAAGLQSAVTVLGASFLSVGIFAGVMLVSGRMKRRAKVPFIPFIAVSFAADLAVRML